MITVKSQNGFKKTRKFLRRMTEIDYINLLEKYAIQGVEALALATPVDTGKTAASWSYEIRRRKDGLAIVWKNTNVVNGVPIAVILQYGHATGTGGYVEGVDYINPVIKPIFEKIAKSAWEEVTR